MITPQQHAQQRARQVETLLNSGALKPALRAAKSAQRAFPDQACFANLTGVALSRSGQLNAALEQFRRAARLDPAWPEPRRNQASALLSAARPGEALRLLTPLAARSAPADPDTLRLLALSRLQTGDAPGAAAAAAALLAQHPTDADMLNLRGVARVAQGALAEALADYQQALNAAPGNPDILANIAHPLALLGQPDTALAALEQALAANPRHLNALHRLGVQLAQLGRAGEAADTFRRKLTLAPTDGEALRELSILTPAADLPALLERTRAATRATARSAPAQVLLAFAEYNILARLPAPDPASTAALTRANAIARRHRPWSAPAAEKAATALLAQMPALPAALPRQPTPDQPRAIFILGLPRSGTTLSEQMLTAHPAVAGLGEFPAAEHWMQSHGPSRPFTPRDATDLARAYRAALPPLPPGCHAFTDKMPGNFRLIGHLLTAFPEATILHIRRHPTDIAWSMWRGYFNNPGLNYTYDQTAMARYFNIYARMMAHWQALCGPRLHSLQYEEITADPETASRRPAALAGLDWHPDMARPEHNRAPVRTASLAQVRAPVHDRSVGLGRANADQLASFHAALDPAFWPDLTT